VRSLSVSDVDWTSTSGSVEVDVDDVDDVVELDVLEVVGPPDVDVELDVELVVDVVALVELVEAGALVDVEGLVLLLDVVPIEDVDVEDVLLIVELVVELVVASVLLDGVLVVELLDVLDVVLWLVELDELVLLDVDELLLVLDDDDVLLLDVVGMVDDDVVVVGEPQDPVCGDTLAGFAGSVPQSSSRRSYVPSRSRSTPTRVPEPRGAQVYVSSCPAVAARFLRFVFVMTASAFRSGWKLLPPTYTQPRATPPIEPLTVRSQRVASSRAIIRSMRPRTIPSFTVAGVMVTCWPTIGACPVSKAITNASTFLRFWTGPVPKLKTGAARKSKTVSIEPSCRKPKPRT